VFEKDADGKGRRSLEWYDELNGWNASHEVDGVIGIARYPRCCCLFLLDDGEVQLEWQSCKFPSSFEYPFSRVFGQCNVNSVLKMNVAAMF
jgi:hypothetical protein